MVNGFILSQLNMVIATLSGIFIIKEAQKVPLWRTALGVIAIFAGCILDSVNLSENVMARKI